MDCDWWARLDPSVACCGAYVSYSKLAYAPNHNSSVLGLGAIYVLIRGWFCNRYSLRGNCSWIVIGGLDWIPLLHAALLT
jgi:hypothetical protein